MWILNLHIADIAKCSSANTMSMQVPNLSHVGILSCAN